MLIKRLLISLGTLGIAGGSGLGIYYGTKNFSSDSSETQKEVLFSGSLIFSQQDKTPNGDSATSKIYKAELSDSQADFGEDEKCKFSDSTLKCKISNLSNEEETRKYLEGLNEKLINLSQTNDSELPKKLKEELVKEKAELEKFFGPEIYTNIQEKLPSSD